MAARFGPPKKIWKKEFDASGMWLYGKLMKIPWTAKQTKESILDELGKTLTLQSKIRKHQTNFFRHAMRRKGFENLITMAQVLGKGSQG